jgi:hypothetical protein
MLLMLRDGTETEIPQDWIDEWNKVYYSVPQTLLDIRIWCLDNPGKRKTKRGLRAFLGRWIRSSCTKRPIAETSFAKIQAIPPEKQLDLPARLSRLAKLKAAIK